MDIYKSAREEIDTSVSSELLTKETKKHHKNTHYLNDHIQTLKWLKKNVKKGDVVLTMGAGDIFHLYDRINKYEN